MIQHSAAACIFVIFVIANVSIHFLEVNQVSAEQRQQLATFERTLGALNTALAHKFCSQICFELKPARQTAEFHSLYNRSSMPLNKLLILAIHYQKQCIRDAGRLLFSVPNSSVALLQYIITGAHYCHNHVNRALYSYMII